MFRPTEDEYPQSPYFSRYIEKVDNEPIIPTLVRQMNTVMELFGNLSAEQEMYRYAEGKWSLKQMLGHLTDSERVFSYRALCIARGEKQALPGFDENEYIKAANFDDQPMDALIRQYHYCRMSTIQMLSSLTEEMLSEIGSANGSAVSARALAWMIAGHELHHLDIIHERYLPTA
jgi:uncharacterized damage-inducible protein DinB